LAHLEHDSAWRMQPWEMTTLFIISSPIKSPYVSYNGWPTYHGRGICERLSRSDGPRDHCPPQSGRAPGDGRVGHKRTLPGASHQILGSLSPCPLDSTIVRNCQATTLHRNGTVGGQNSAEGGRRMEADLKGKKDKTIPNTRLGLSSSWWVEVLEICTREMGCDTREKVGPRYRDAKCRTL
jgi:hypothetical protein